MALDMLRTAERAFADLKDEYSRAVTMGRIADILQARGETDEALRIHLEERLPVALAMQDSDGVAHIRFNCATIRLQRGGSESEGEVIVSELAESFAINRRLGRVDAIGAVGFLFGQLLAATARRTGTRPTLRLTLAAGAQAPWVWRMFRAMSVFPSRGAVIPHPGMTIASPLPARGSS